MMEWFANWSVWHWLIFGLLLLIGEILLPGVFLLWWGLAALIVATLVFIANISTAVAFIIYAIIASILSILWWKYQHQKDNQDQSHTPLNQRDHRMLGKLGIVQEMQPNGIGRGHFDDTTWRIQGTGLQQGDTIRVIKVEGITLFVEKVEQKA